MKTAYNKPKLKRLDRSEALAKLTSAAASDNKDAQAILELPEPGAGVLRYAKRALRTSLR